MAEKDGDRKPTERVVLKRVRALVLDGLTEQTQGAIDEMIKSNRKDKAEIVEAWQVAALVEAPSKLAAIEAHAGKPGTPDALIGVYRAPTMTSWKDGVSYAAPPAPLVERTTVD